MSGERGGGGADGKWGIERIVGRLCAVGPGELNRLRPFFLLYLMLFAALTLGDGLSIALFVSRVGAEALPGWYGRAALATALAMTVYLRALRRVDPARVFQVILWGGVGVLGVVWVGASGGGGGSFWFGLLFVTREILFTLVLAHFGTFLQDYFLRVELNRVLPLIYAGGRLGGLLGSLALEGLAPWLGLVSLLGVLMLLLGGASAVMRWVVRKVPRVEEAGEAVMGSGRRVDGKADQSGVRRLLGWFLVTSLLFMMVRWVLNFEYNQYFAGRFRSEEELASFLGRYCRWALLASLLIQATVVTRLVRWVGLKGAHALYGLMLVGSLGCNLGAMTLGAAVVSRLLESELRFCLRNPVNQMYTNLFTKGMRAQIRGWAMGFFNPLAALLASGVLGGLQGVGRAAWIPWVGLVLGLSYVGASLFLYRCFEEPGSGGGASGDVLKRGERSSAKLTTAGAR